MHKGLEGHGDGVSVGAYLVQRRLARQHDTAHAHVLQEAGAGRRAGVALGGGVEGDGRDGQTQQRHILHYQRVHTGGIQLADGGDGLVKLVLKY